MSIIKKTPNLWLLALLFILPQCSEALYTTALSRISLTTDNIAEWTITLYLIGFAGGILLWGALSNHLGRRGALLAGFSLFLIGSLCAFTLSLTLGRLLQGLGGSAGPLLGQIIVRETSDSEGTARNFSLIGAPVALAPVFIPSLGGHLVERFDWSSVFVFLTFFTSVTLLLIYFKLPETATPNEKLSPKRFFSDTSTLAYVVAMAAANAVTFCIYCNAPFYLNLSPSHYGYTFLLTSLGGVLGALYSNFALKNTSTTRLLKRGTWTLLTATLSLYALESPSLLTTLFLLFTMKFSVGMVFPSILTLAVAHFKKQVAAASTLFGFGYYLLTALFNHQFTTGNFPLTLLTISLIGFAAVQLATRQRQPQAAVEV